MKQNKIKLNTTAHAILLGIWLYCIASILLPESMLYAPIFQGIFIFLIVAHAIECIVYRKMLNGVQEYLWVMYSGLLFIEPKKRYLTKLKKAQV